MCTVLEVGGGLGKFQVVVLYARVCAREWFPRSSSCSKSCTQHCWRVTFLNYSTRIHTERRDQFHITRRIRQRAIESRRGFWSRWLICYSNIPRRGNVIRFSSASLCSDYFRSRMVASLFRIPQKASFIKSASLYFCCCFQLKIASDPHIFLCSASADYLLERDYAPPPPPSLRDFSITWQSNNCRACGTWADDHPPWNLIQYHTLCGEMSNIHHIVWQIFIMQQPREMQLCSPKKSSRWIMNRSVVVVDARPSRWWLRRSARQPIFALFSCLSAEKCAIVSGALFLCMRCMCENMAPLAYSG